MSRRHQQKMAMEEEAKLKLQMQLSSLQQEVYFLTISRVCFAD